MAINKRRFSREATYARRCLRGRSCARGRVVPCPAPQPGKFSGMGMQDRRPPRMRKKFPHQDSTLPPSLCPIRTPGPYPQHATETTRETTEATAAGPILSPCSLSGGRSSPQEPPGRPQVPPLPGRSACPPPPPGGRSRPQKLPGRPLRPPPPGPVCTPPCQEAAAGPRSHQGDHRGHRRRGGYFQCQEGL